MEQRVLHQRPTWSSALLQHPLFASVIVWSLMIGVCWNQIPRHVPDSEWYIASAEGQHATVRQPFAGRVLHPYLVRMLTTGANISTSQGFRALALISLFLLVGTVILLLRAEGVSGFTAPLLICTPLLIQITKDAYLPDLFHAALLGVFLWSLAKNRTWLSAAVLLGLLLTRESTLLLSIVLVVVALMNGRRRLAGLWSAVTAGGYGLASLASHQGQPNIHGLPNLVYVGIKIPYNFARNILGIVFWSNTLAADTVDFPERPWVTVGIPHQLHIASIHAIGLYRIDPAITLRTLSLVLTVFGVGPAVGAALIKQRAYAWPRTPLWIRVAFWYGTLAFLLAPSLGTSVDRLLSYGWPAFWLAVPAFIVP